MKFGIFYLALLLSGATLAQDSLMERVGIRVAKESPPSCETGHEGALAGGAVTILPGETICLKVKVTGDFVTPVAVVDVADPADTLILKFWQEPGTHDMFLTLHNPLNAFLTYKAFMLRPGNLQREYTTSCPVLSKRLGIEQWPHLVNELTLSDFASIPESKKIGCR